jgi:dipeptidyl aminopeptidase/acylaminoacyl peptidase
MPKRYPTIAFLAVFAPTYLAWGQNTPQPGPAPGEARPVLTVPYIMRDPKWIGTSPSEVTWADDGKKVYFRWNPDRLPESAWYAVSPGSPVPARVAEAEPRQAATFGPLNRARTKKLFALDGDIFLKDLAAGTTLQLTNTVEAESSPRFSLDEAQVVYRQGLNLFALHLKTGTLAQLTNFQRGSKPAGAPTKPANEKWLEADQYRWFEVLRERKEKSDRQKNLEKILAPERPKEIFIQEKNLENPQASPDGRFVTYRLSKGSRGKLTAVPNYVTASGFTENLNARPKVGDEQATYELWVYDRQRDTTYLVNPDKLPGLDQPPAFVKEYAKPGEAKPTKREVAPVGPFWSPGGTRAALVYRSLDNKDRWLVLLDVATGSLQVVDRQHDEAWIGGPGIDGFSLGAGRVGWLPDDHTFYFQSEVTGWSHLYVYDARTQAKKALTAGNYEVRSVQLSNDGKHFYLTTSETHPGEDHFYKIPVSGGPAVKLTSLAGGNEASLSPDEKYLAIRHSTSNRPWELYLMENKPGAKPVQVTQSLTDEFRAYPWRAPEVTTLPARDGAQVYARVYAPAPAQRNGAAVIFVHGAGYLQNAHKYWSSYFREYMFHNLLADKGYVVLDIDYRASAGYGRDWRTGIYRHMGGKDLTDHLDGAKWLTEKYGVDAKRIGIYGGSYGGFITLMGMFTAPGTFAAGAALRPVTDWAHYNHGYTNNILNTPVGDSLAYAKSSPIYHAEKLEGALLICHGMIDVNVHFQDVVRLSQRLIELGKDNWELAVYPLEDHGFVEPSSWADEYKRILKLFDQHLGKKP